MPVDSAFDTETSNYGAVFHLLAPPELLSGSMS
jgi:hypothetical protein